MADRATPNASDGPHETAGTFDVPIPDTEPWERQPDEGDSGWEAFTIYRDLGPGHRSQRVVAKTLGKSAGIVARWSAQHGWPARCAAFDIHVDKERVLAHLEEVREMRRRHANVSMVAIGALLQPIAALTSKRRIVTDAGTVEEVDRAEDLREADTHHLVRMAESASRAIAILVGVERVSRGQPADVPHLEGDDEMQHDPGYARLPEDDERLAGLLDALVDAGLDPSRVFAGVDDGDDHDEDAHAAPSEPPG